MAVVDNVEGRLEEVSAALGLIEATSNYANSSSGPFKREAAMVVAFYADARRYLGRTASSCARLLLSASKRRLLSEGEPVIRPEIRVYVSVPADEATLDLRRWGHAIIPSSRCIRGLGESES